jgi:hypothetical protein
LQHQRNEAELVKRKEGFKYVSTINKLDTLGLLAIKPQTHVTFGVKVAE